MKNLNDLDVWKSNFGLLPIHLNSLKIPSQNEYILLNGGYGDFCLHNNEELKEPEAYFSKSWSSNTKFFVHINEEYASLFNWEKEKEEKIKVTDIVNNLDKFYNYLLNKSYKTQNDIVPFVLDIFKRLRNSTQEASQPVEALNLLHHLLISVGVENNINFNNQQWGIEDINLPNEFDYYRDLITQGIGSVKPDLSLILRHVSGLLFQEAQKEVLFFNPQTDLFGGFSSEQKSKRNLYSSVHYTPQYLARSVVENVLKNIDLTKPTLKILDPACGAAEFLIETLKQLQEANYSGNIQIIGWDTSETAVSSSRFLLNYEKNIFWKGRLQFTINVVEDSLTENWDNDYDIIVMNPPFISYELIKSRESKNVLKDVLGDLLSKGKPNLAGGFFYKASQHLANDGILGCVLPSSLLTFHSYNELRNRVSEILNIQLIGRFGNFVFENALTDVSIFIGKNEASKTSPIVLWGQNEKGVPQNLLRDLRKMQSSNQVAIDENEYSVYRPRKFPLIIDSWKPLSLKGSKFYKDIERYILEEKLIRLNDVFTIRQGIRMGIKDVFKISPNQYLDLPDPDKDLFRPVIENATIKNGIISLTNYVWYPYNENGSIFSGQQNELQNIDFFKNYIEPNEIRLRKRAKIKDWWSHTWPRNWQYSKKIKLVSTEFGTSSSFALDLSGDYVVERGYAYLPKREFELEDYFFYLAFFTSDIYNQLLSIYSKQLAGGKSYDLGNKYSKNIPIPDVSNPSIKNTSFYKKMCNTGKEISEGNSYAKSLVNELLTHYLYPSIK